MTNEPVVNFYAHKMRGATDSGARDDFEDMVVDLVATIHPAVWGIRANPGDWGIDALVGDLDGEVAIWQAKYFIDGYAKSQRDQVHESFRRALKEAENQGHTVKYWTLCIPVDLDAPERKAWQIWKRKQEKDHSLAMELWSKARLRRLLISPDACDVLRHYYGDGPIGRVPRSGIPTVEAPLDGSLDRTLFVRQLEYAGHVATSAAKKQFFNAEILARDVSDKKNRREVEALEEAYDLTFSIWEEHYNQHSSKGPGPKYPALVSDVMDGIRSQCSLLTPQLPARLIHYQGMAHQHVDRGTAGWAQGWESIRDESISIDGEELTDAEP